MSSGRMLKWITGALEAVLGIPLLGGAIATSLVYTPLMILLTLHIITLVYCNQEGLDKAPSLLGIITSCIAWIPIVGMLMHLLTAAFLLSTCMKEHRGVNV